MGWKRSAALAVGSAALVYAATLLPYLAHGCGVEGVWRWHENMWWFHTHMPDTAGQSAAFYTWPLQIRPVVFASGVDGQAPWRMLALGNRLLWWSIPVALVGGVVRARRLRAHDLIPVAAVLATWAPWALLNRFGMSYYLLPALPFVSVSVASLLGAARRARGSSWSRRSPRVVASLRSATEAFWGGGDRRRRREGLPGERGPGCELRRRLGRAGVRCTRRVAAPRRRRIEGGLRDPDGVHAGATRRTWARTYTRRRESRGACTRAVGCTAGARRDRGRSSAPHAVRGAGPSTDLGAIGSDRRRGSAPRGPIQTPPTDLSNARGGRFSPHGPGLRLPPPLASPLGEAMPAIHCAIVALLLVAGCRREPDSRRESNGDAAALDDGPAVALATADQDSAAAEEKKRAALAELADAAPCRAPLAEYCPCPTYDAAWQKAVKDSRTVPCSAGSVETGNCGEHRYVATTSRTSGSTLYFAKDGHLIGAESGADYRAYCDKTSSTISFGSIPTCTRQRQRKVCREEPRGVGCICGDPLCVSDAGCVEPADRRAPDPPR